MNAPEPATETQRRLSAIWCEVLQIDSVGIDDSFFEIGGDSLLALQIYDRLRRHYGREFPLFDLSFPATIRGIAAVIDGELSGRLRNPYRALQRIQPGDPSATPLFLVHGGDGNARVFKRLSKNLDPRIPLYGFRWAGWDGLRGDTTLRAMAETYCNELDTFQPGGPVRIGGYCIGGLVALEMAAILAQRGRVVEGPLYIWDCPNVRSRTYRRREPWYDQKDYVVFRRMADQLAQGYAHAVPDGAPLVAPTEFSGTYQLLRRYPHCYNFARTAQIRIATLPITLRLHLGRPVPIKSRWIYAMTTCFFAVKNHSPSRFPGRVVFFRSGVHLGRDMNLPGWWEDPFMGFPDLCGTFEGHVVGGDHVGVLSQPAGARIVNESYFGRSDA